LYTFDAFATLNHQSVTTNNLQFMADNNIRIRDGVQTTKDQAQRETWDAFRNTDPQKDADVLR